MEVTKPRGREPGNKECVEMLERWLREARRGQMVHVAVAACVAPNFIHSHAVGTVQTESDILEAIDQLKMKLYKSACNRLIPFDPNLPVNQVSFNIAAGVVSFDFLAWVIGAEMHRRRYKEPEPLRVCFYKRSETEVLTNSSYHSKMFDNVVGPLVQALGGSTNHIVGGKSDFSLTHNEITEACLKGEAVPQLEPTEVAVEAVDRVLDKNGQPPVTITLRETENYPERNSNHRAWMKFAGDLQAKGEKIIFVRDTAKAMESFDDFATFPPASSDLHVRLALYKRAKCNLFVANGPATLNWHLPTPFLMFSQLDPGHDGRFPPAWPEWWKTRMGINAGEQFPWFTAQQKIVWQPDSYENICAAWEAR